MVAIVQVACIGEVEWNMQKPVGILKSLLAASHVCTRATLQIPVRGSRPSPAMTGIWEAR